MKRFSEKTQKLIDAQLSKPFEVGDSVVYHGEGNGSKDPSMSAMGKILGIDGTTATISPRSYSTRSVIRDFSQITQSYLEIGANPIIERRVHQKYAIAVNQLLSRLGYDTHGDLDDNKMSLKIDGVVQCNTDPVVVGDDGHYYHFQRGLVWDLEDKQKLIRSLYDGINIGSFVFRDKSYDRVMSDSKNPKYPVDASWLDLVDGKQRADAILSFIRCEYPDHYGYYWNDLSIQTRSKFLSIMNMTYIEMHEDTTDLEVLEYFILLNDTGRPIDKELISLNKEILKKL